MVEEFMKPFLILVIFISTLALADEIKDFNKVLLQGVRKDIKNENNDSFKRPAARGPASVQEADIEPHIEEDKKIDKMNIKQLGSSKW